MFDDIVGEKGIALHNLQRECLEITVSSFAFRIILNQEDLLWQSVRIIQQK